MSDIVFSEVHSDCATDRDIEERYNAARSAATDWQELPPDREGWYWRRDHGKLDIVKVTRQRCYGDQLCCLHGANYGPVEQSINALWSGPIQHPREP